MENHVSDGRGSLRRPSFFQQQKKEGKERRLKPAVLRIPYRGRSTVNAASCQPREWIRSIFPLVQKRIDVLLTTPLRHPFPSHFVPAKRGAFGSPLSLPLSPHHLLRQKRGTSSNSPRCFRHRRRHGEFLETASLHPQLAARRLFPLSRLLFCKYRITFFFRFIFYHRQKPFLNHSHSEWFSLYKKELSNQKAPF